MDIHVLRNADNDRIHCQKLFNWHTLCIACVYLVQLSISLLPKVPWKLLSFYVLLVVLYYTQTFLVLIIFYDLGFMYRRASIFTFPRRLMF
jgi:hypothetical protein